MVEVLTGLFACGELTSALQRLDDEPAGHTTQRGLQQVLRQLVSRLQHSVERGLSTT